MKKKDKKWKFPKRSPLTYLLLILSVIVLFLAIFIPIQYVEYYNQNKVVPFETETKDVDVTHGSLSSLPDFNLLVTCTDYIDKKIPRINKIKAVPNSEFPPIKMTNPMKKSRQHQSQTSDVFQLDRR